MGSCCALTLAPLQTETAVDHHASSTNRSEDGGGFNLIGHLMLQGGTKHLPPTELQEILECVWKPTRPWKLVKMGRSYYRLCFSSLEDQFRVAMRSCWFVKHGLMKVDFWAPGFNPYEPGVTMVRWTPPPPSWIKINTDGSVRGRSGGGMIKSAACGGVFRDSQSSVLGCFSKKLGSGCACALEAELDGAITALEIACAQGQDQDQDQGGGWNKIWLESDCSELVTMLCARSRHDATVPMGLKDRWLGVLEFLDKIEFEVSHIYREGNRVADALANPDAEDGLWACATPAIQTFVHEDALGCEYPRFRV